MRRLLKVVTWIIGTLVILLVSVVTGLWIAGNTATGLRFIERTTARVTGGYVMLTGLGGSLPSALTLEHLELVDAHGVWLSADDVVLRWSPVELLWRWISVDELQAQRVHIERAPYSEAQNPSSTPSIPHIDVAKLAVQRLELGAPLVGTAATVSLTGKLRLRSLQNMDADLAARRLDGDGDYAAHVHFKPKQLEATVALREPAGGPLENLLQLPGLGALNATLTLKGPKNAEVVDMALDAGALRARARGSVDLIKAAADLEFSLDSPSLQPRPDVEWQHIVLTGSWHGPLASVKAAGHLEVAGLRIGSDVRVRQLTAELGSNAGSVSVHGLVDGLEIPGSSPRLFASDSIKVDATLDLGDAARPLDLKASHRLLALHARTATAGARQIVLDLKVPELAPFAALGGQDVRGQAAIKAQVTPGSKTAIKLEADVGLSGGTAGYLKFVGPKLNVQLAGDLSSDAYRVDQLRLVGNGITAAVKGAATRAAVGPKGVIKDVQAHWDVSVADLAVLSPDLAGSLKGSGQVIGPASLLTADASVTATLAVRGGPGGRVDVTAHARGLPGTPSATLQIQGRLDDAPLKVDVALEHAPSGSIKAEVRQGDWKSAHLAGEMAWAQDFTLGRGRFSARVEQLGDLNRLLGTTLSGRLDALAEFVPAAGKTHVQAQVDVHDLPLNDSVASAQVKAEGFLDALNLDLGVEVPRLAGQAARLKAAATLHPDAQQLHVNSATATFRGQDVSLTAPMVVSFAKGIAIDQLSLSAQEARFELKGQLSPTLDLRASLAGVKPALVNGFLPGLLDAGNVEVRARLQGTLAAPTGRVRLDAKGVRFGNDAASGLPAFDAEGRAELTGSAAMLDMRLSAQPNSLVSVSGALPLAADGPIDLKIGGTLDIGLINPLLEARGLHATGEIGVDANVTGSAGAPQIGGGVTLAKGSLRDYGRGINLSDITAEAVGSQGTLQIKSFVARAASGSITMSGSVGVLEPDLPVALKIVAKNAQPISSSIVTANLDADVSIAGTIRQRLDVAGTVRVNRATIGIPNSLPPDVAVLDVRRRGQAAPEAAEKAAVVGVDVSIKAPQEILVQGRGLDAELGGEIHLTGTTDDLAASGGFDLQRGSFTLAGTKLNFTEGRVSFDGAGLRKKIDPTLDFTAQTSLPDVTATLRITGVADAPRFDFTSTPSLPQDQIMARLLFGENAAQLTALQAAQIGAALATLSGVGGGNANPLVKLQRTLGLDRLNVSTNNSSATTRAENTGTSIEAGRYVSKRVYIEAKQTTTGASQVQVDVDLTKHLKLQTRLGTGNTAITQGTTPENDPGSSVGLSYQFEY